MRLTARELLALGVPATRVRISLERNMRCGVAECGHCQLGPLLLCRDGPVAEPNTAALIPQLRRLGMGTAALRRVFATFNVAAPGFERARAQAAERSP